MASGRKQNPQNPSAQRLFSSIDFAENVPWTRNLFSWFGGGCDRSHRYAAYVFGAEGVGKTRIVRAMIHGMNVFECRLTNQFAFHGFSSTTDVLLVDDVRLDKFDRHLRSTLKRIMSRQPAVVQRRRLPQETVVDEHVQTIFTSRFKLLDDYSFRLRCYRVWANVKACKDIVSDQDDDSGDDDTFFVDPKLPSIQVHAAVK